MRETVNKGSQAEKEWNALLLNIPKYPAEAEELEKNERNPSQELGTGFLLIP